MQRSRPAAYASMLAFYNGSGGFGAPSRSNEQRTGASCQLSNGRMLGVRYTPSLTWSRAWHYSAIGVADQSAIVGRERPSDLGLGRHG